MVGAVKQKVKKTPPNHAARPHIWQDEMREVKETFRRVAEVKRSGFSEWKNDDGVAMRRGSMLRRNRQIRVRSLVPSQSLHLPAKFLKEIQNNRSVSPFVSFSHFQNVRGMCRRIESMCSVTERKKNPFDVGIYPAFVRRPASVGCFMNQTEFVFSEEGSTKQKQNNTKAPLSYTPFQLKLLYDISNGGHPSCARPLTSPPPTQPHSRSNDRPFSQGSPNASSPSYHPQHQQSVRNINSIGSDSSRSSTQSENSSGSSSSRSSSSCSGFQALDLQLMDRRPPSRCMRRPNSGQSWEEKGADLSNGSTYPDAMPSARSVISDAASDCLSESSATDRSSSFSQIALKFSASAGKLSDFPRHRECSPPSPSFCSRPQPRSGRRSVPLCAFASASASMSCPNLRPAPSLEVPRVEGGRPCSASIYSGSVRRNPSNRVTFATSPHPLCPPSKGLFSSFTFPPSSAPPTSSSAAAGPPTKHKKQIKTRSNEHTISDSGRGGCVEDSDVIVKYSTHPYGDFKASMRSMIRREHLEDRKEELEDMFRYYLDLNPPIHHPTLKQLILDIRKELNDRKRQTDRQTAFLSE